MTPGIVWPFILAVPPKPQKQFPQSEEPETYYHFPVPETEFPCPCPWNWNVLPFPCPWNWISLSLSLKLKRTTISLSQPPFPLSDSVQFPTLSLSNDFCLEFNLLNTWADKLSNVKSHRYVSWWYLSRKVMNIHLYKRGNVKGGPH